MLGRRSNHSSNFGAPVAIVRPAGIPCISVASATWISFHTSTRSGVTRISPLPVRLSQLAIGIAHGIASLRALFTYSTWVLANSTTGETSTASGFRSRRKSSTTLAVGIARSTAPSLDTSRRDSFASVSDWTRRISRSVSDRVSGSIARAVRTWSVSLRAIRARSAGASA